MAAKQINKAQIGFLPSTKHFETIIRHRKYMFVSFMDPTTTMKFPDVSPARFFEVWKQVCGTQQGDLVAAWKCGNHDYTTQVLHANGAVLAETAKKLELHVNSNYYSLDAIFTYERDKVTCAPETQNWFQNIRVAFEHENSVCSGLFKEVSHLLITRADLRVLVTYPDKEDFSDELKQLAEIIRNSDLAKTDPVFLLITGWLNKFQEIEWSAFTFQRSELLPMKL
jgi:hypothetical protein